MYQAQVIKPIPIVTSSYECLHRYLERAQEALVHGDKTALRDYATSARAVLNSLDSALDYSFGELATALHSVYAYISKLIDMVLLGQDQFCRMSVCLELSAGLARAWKAVNPDA